MTKKTKWLSTIVFASMTSTAMAVDVCVDKDVSDLDGYVTTIRSSLPPISKAQESTYRAIIEKHVSPPQAIALSGDQTFALWRIWYFSEQTRSAFVTAARATTIKAKLNNISNASAMAEAIAGNLESVSSLLDGPNPTREGLLLWGSAQSALYSGTVGLSKALQCYAQQLPG